MNGSSSLADPVGQLRWTALYQVSLLAASMLVGAFGAGILPLYASLSQKQLKLFNSLGTGLLIGTALAVIIPEGVEELYHEDGHHEHQVDVEVVADEHEGEWKKNLIGVALVSGFFLMLLIDHFACCGGSHGHGHSHAYSPVFESDDVRKELSELGLSDDEGETGIEMSEVSSPIDRSRKNKAGSGSTCSQPHDADSTKRRATVTIGLLVHAAADGIALGAAKASSTQENAEWGRLEFVVFIAIMMHKVPASFALTIFLKNSGVDNGAIRRSLLLFASAAPVGTLATFLVLHPGFLAAGSLSEGVVGFILLLSGGTFMYVGVVHAFQELPRNSNGEMSHYQVLAICVGSMLPIAMSAGHSH